MWWKCRVRKVRKVRNGMYLSSHVRLWVTRGLRCPSPSPRRFTCVPTDLTLLNYLPISIPFQPATQTPSTTNTHNTLNNFNLPSPIPKSTSLPQSVRISYQFDLLIYPAPRRPPLSVCLAFNLPNTCIIPLQRPSWFPKPQF